MIQSLMTSWGNSCQPSSSTTRTFLAWGASLSLLLLSCSQPYPRCNEIEARVLHAAAFGDTVVLADYLSGTEEYDFRCRRHDDPLRAGESLHGAVMETRYPAVLRTYLRFPIQQEIKDKLLWRRAARDSGNVLTRILLAHGAHLTYPAKECIVRDRVMYYERFDSLGYDFNWVAPTTGNNILMDYCSCSLDFQREDLKKVLGYFIGLGVRTNVKNHDGETAYDIATRSGVINVLREAESK